MFGTVLYMSISDRESPSVTRAGAVPAVTARA
jgi:hypothetical protein